MQTVELNTFFTELAMHLDGHRLQLNDLETFFDGLADRLAIFKMAKKQMDRFIASDFSVFSYISVDEGRLSDILRDLLDPDGLHGQGDVFLVEFLRLIGCEECYGPGDCVSVDRESTTDRIQRTQRRLDLLIDIRRDSQHWHGIAIENKPWALDQKDQITDYLANLKKIYPDGHYRIVYLTRNGSPPSEYSVRDVESLRQQRTLLLMAYTMDTNSLRHWLNACQQVCQAEKVRWFLRDLSQYIQQNLPYEALDTDDSLQQGVSSMISETEKQQIADYVLDQANPKRLELAIGIAESYEEIKRQIIFEFVERLQVKLREQFPAFMIYMDLKEYLNKYVYAGIFKSDWYDEEIGIVFEAQSLGARNFIIGVCKPKSREHWPHLCAALNNGYIAGKRSDWYDYYRPFDSFVNWDNETLIKLRDPKSLQYVVEQFERIRAIAEPIIDGEMMTSRTTSQEDDIA